MTRCGNMRSRASPPTALAGAAARPVVRSLVDAVPRVRVVATAEREDDEDHEEHHIPIWT